MVAAQTRSLAKARASSFSVYSMVDLDANFVRRNLNTLNYSRGAGFWLWKPYIILKHLDRIPEGDLLVYVDCGVLPKQDFTQILEFEDISKVHLWLVDGMNFLEWTDPEVLKKMKVRLEESSLSGVMAGGIVAINNKFTRKTFSKWLKICEQPSLLRPETLPNFKKSEGFYWHRHDQSLLNCLVALHPTSFRLHGGNLDTHRLDRFFDVHRNMGIKSCSIILSFPQLRNFRSRFISLLPTPAKVLIRSYKAKKSGKFASATEFEEVRKSFK